MRLVQYKFAQMIFLLYLEDKYRKKKRLYNKIKNFSRYIELKIILLKHQRN